MSYTPIPNPLPVVAGDPADGSPTTQVQLASILMELRIISHYLYELNAGVRADITDSPSAFRADSTAFNGEEQPC